MTHIPDVQASLDDCFSEAAFSTLWALSEMEPEVAERARRSLTEEETSLLDLIISGSSHDEDRRRAAEIMADNSYALEHFAAYLKPAPSEKAD